MKSIEDGLVLLDVLLAGLSIVEVDEHVCEVMLEFYCLFLADLCQPLLLADFLLLLSVVRVHYRLGRRTAKLVHL